MITKIKNSLAFRTGWVYKYLLKILPTGYAPKKTASGLFYITLVGKDHLAMLEQNLRSLIRSWKTIPMIKIYSDGSIAISKIMRRLKPLKLPITYLTWEECLNDFDAATDKDIISFAKKHVIGKKLLIILANGRKGVSLWCDADIIWYDQLQIPDEDIIRNESLYIKSSQDYQPAYSNNILSSYPELLQQPYINTGLVLFKGDLRNLSYLKKAFEIASEFPDHFSEQSIIAISIFHCDGLVWNENEIACYQTDQLTLKPTYIKKNWTARHYVGPVRHLFWRDAFFLRIVKR